MSTVNIAAERGKDVEDVVLGKQPPRPPDHEMGSIESAPKIKEDLSLDDIKTAPADIRFPTTNQTRHCFTRYIEFHKCIQVKGDDNKDCEKFKWYYRSLCPDDWIQRWDEQRENGTFPGPL